MIWGMLQKGQQWMLQSWPMRASLWWVSTAAARDRLVPSVVSVSTRYKPARMPFVQGTALPLGLMNVLGLLASATQVIWLSSGKSLLVICCADTTLWPSVTWNHPASIGRACWTGEPYTFTFQLSSTTLCKTLAPSPSGLQLGTESLQGL